MVDAVCSSVIEADLGHSVHVLGVTGSVAYKSACACDVLFLNDPALLEASVCGVGHLGLEMSRCGLDEHVAGKPGEVEVGVSRDNAVFHNLSNPS